MLPFVCLTGQMMEVWVKQEQRKHLQPLILTRGRAAGSGELRPDCPGSALQRGGWYPHERQMSSSSSLGKDLRKRKGLRKKYFFFLKPRPFLSPDTFFPWSSQRQVWPSLCQSLRTALPGRGVVWATSHTRWTRAQQFDRRGQHPLNWASSHMQSSPLGKAHFPAHRPPSLTWVRVSFSLQIANAGWQPPAGHKLPIRKLHRTAATQANNSNKLTMMLSPGSLSTYLMPLNEVSKCLPRKHVLIFLEVSFPIKLKVRVHRFGDFKRRMLHNSIYSSKRSFKYL